MQWMVSGPEGTPPDTKPIVEERVNVAINPEYLDTSSILSWRPLSLRKAANKLFGLLQRISWKCFCGLDRSASNVSIEEISLEYSDGKRRESRRNSGHAFCLWMDHPAQMVPAADCYHKPRRDGIHYPLDSYVMHKQQKWNMSFDLPNLRIVEQMGVKNLQANVDSRLVAN
ncbi:hypothetical protein Tco_1157234 [Tanacetum coccineum]